MQFDSFILVGVTDDLTEEPKARQAADAVEFQMDSAKDPIKQLSEYSGGLPLIVTDRPGGDNGDSKDRIDNLSLATEIEQVEAIDLELNTVLENNHAEQLLAESNHTSIISYQNFENTPNNERSREIIEKSKKFGDVVRFEGFAQDTMDILLILSLISEYSDKGLEISGISLGNIGKHSRTVTHRYGSKVGYAPINKTRVDSDPGEIELEKLAKLIGRVDDEESQIQIPPSLKKRFEDLGWEEQQ